MQHNAAAQLTSLQSTVMGSNTPSLMPSVNKQTGSGIAPVRSFPCSFRVSSAVSCPSSDGTAPFNKLKLSWSKAIGVRWCMKEADLTLC